MNRFALIGASYKTAGVEKLGRLALPKADLEQRLAGIAQAAGVAELAYIGTCNRIEFMVADKDPVAVQAARDRIGELLGEDTGEARKLFRAWAGEGAIEHLFLVAAGLDSAQAGEREIYAQVRLAWATARAAGTCGPQLDYIFNEALKAAQDVHQQASRPANAESLSGFAVRRVNTHLAGDTGRVALVGISPMTRQCGRVLAAQGLSLIVVNRTFETAQEFAAEIGAEAVALEAFKADPGVVDAVVTAVGGAEPVLDYAAVGRMAAQAPSRGIVIVDLGVPPNVDPAVGSIERIHRIGMDSVIAEAAAGRTQRLGELASARLIIDEHLDRLRRDYAIREAAPMIQLMGNHYQALAAESLKRLPRGKNGEDTEALRQWAESFARKLAHAPIKGLRVLAAEAGPQAVQAYMRGVEEALAPKLSSSESGARVVSTTSTEMLDEKDPT
ncbi:MAG: glutamyl-tRNA reductase [Rhodospirillaceae bacterium]